jgi:hypothetical protein
MFSSLDMRRKGALTVHPALRRAASLARAFILLEDSELSGAHVPAGEPAHPHRVPLRPDLGMRRPGAGASRPQLCLTPVASGGHRMQQASTTKSRPEAALRSK